MVVCMHTLACEHTCLLSSQVYSLVLYAKARPLNVTNAWRPMRTTATDRAPPPALSTLTPAPPSQDKVSKHATQVWFDWIQYCKSLTRGQHNTGDSLLVRGSSAHAVSIDKQEVLKWVYYRNQTSVLVCLFMCVIIRPVSHHLRLLDVIPAVYDNHRPLCAHMCVCVCMKERVGGSSSGSHCIPSSQ